MKNSNNYYNKDLKDCARKLRKEGTKSEIRLWKTTLRNRSLKGYQFLRQRPIGKFIADFFCKELRLIIELDGITHNEKIKNDLFRQVELESMGYSVLRFTDDEVHNNLEGVQIELIKWIEEFEKNHPPYPPSKGEVI